MEEMDILNPTNNISELVAANGCSQQCMVGNKFVFSLAIAMQV